MADHEAGYKADHEAGYKAEYRASTVRAPEGRQTDSFKWTSLGAWA